MAATRERVAAPVINGVCYGCQVSIAAAKAGEQGPARFRVCENCGCFIHILS